MKSIQQHINELINESITVKNLSDFDSYSIKHCSRKEVNDLIELLDSLDISYSLDGVNEKIEFDYTELSKDNQKLAAKLLGLKH